MNCSKIFFFKVCAQVFINMMVYWYVRRFTTRIVFCSPRNGTPIQSNTLLVQILCSWNSDAGSILGSLPFECPTGIQTLIDCTVCWSEALREYRLGKCHCLHICFLMPSHWIRLSSTLFSSSAVTGAFVVTVSVQLHASSARIIHNYSPNCCFMHYAPQVCQEMFSSIDAQQLKHWLMLIVP